MMSTEERWVHIAKLEADNRVSRDKNRALIRAHERKMQRINNISNAVGIAMSIFSPLALMALTSKRKDND
jgi:hypothetical protein